MTFSPSAVIGGRLSNDNNSATTAYHNGQAQSANDVSRKLQ